MGQEVTDESVLECGYKPAYYVKQYGWILKGTKQDKESAIEFLMKRYGVDAVVSFLESATVSFWPNELLENIARTHKPKPKPIVRTGIDVFTGKKCDD